MTNLLEIKSIKITSKNNNSEVLLKDSDFTIEKGKVVSIVGQSGTGKSLFAYAIMGKEFIYNAKKEYKIFKYKGNEVDDRHERNISYIPQEPLSSLNPVLTIFQHFEINLKIIDKNLDIKDYAKRLLDEVGFDKIDELLKKYPHELSGGMAQRVLIALSLENNPEMIIADEATSSLDAVIEKLILDLLAQISKDRELTILIITHDPRIVSNYCDECYQIKDSLLSKLDNVFQINKLHEKNKLSIEKDNQSMSKRNPKPKVELIQLSKLFFKFETTKHWVLQELNLSINRGEAVGLIGLSGSGKSTISKLITKLLLPNKGQVLFEGETVDLITRKDYAKKVQIVFQDLFGSLNPKKRIKNILLDSFWNDKEHSTTEKINKINDSLLKVGLNEDILDKNASNLSGGQRQKILILRAVLSNPEFIVFDEPMSSLDLKSQLEIIRIIKNLIKNNNLTMLFITHDFRLIQDLCDKVFVLSNGSIVEKGSTIEVFKNPQHDETKRLLQVVK